MSTTMGFHPRGAALLATAWLLAGVATAKAPFSKPELYAMGRQSSKQGDFVRAAAAFEDMVRAEAAGFTLQLAVVCERDTIARFTDAADSEEGFYFLAASVKGRPCFKALWGTFPSAGEARAAVTALPPGIALGDAAPIPVPIAKLLGADLPAPPPAPSSAPPPAPAPARVATSGTPAPPRPPSAPPKVFSDADLKSYRSRREAEEAKYGTPKPLFEEVDLRTLDPPKTSAKGKKGSKGGKAAPAPLPDPVTITSPPAKSDEGYWKTLVGNAKGTVETKRKARDAASAKGDAAATKAAEAELSAAEAALADLRARAAERGADAAWLD